jgi:hypothetical protein
MLMRFWWFSRSIVCCTLRFSSCLLVLHLQKLLVHLGARLQLVQQAAATAARPASSQCP